MNPYELLGLDEGATIDAVRKSYRKRAKKLHPDSPGGDAEKFFELKLAHDILADPVRRKKYDETGDISEKSPDNEMSQVIGIIASALESVLSQIEGRRGEPTEFELVNDMKILVGGKLDEIQRRISQLKSARVKTEKLIGRFGVRDGENYLEGIIVGKLSALDTNIRMTEAQEEPVKKALDILKNSTFRADCDGTKSGYNYGSSYRFSDLLTKANLGVGLA